MSSWSNRYVNPSILKHKLHTPSLKNENNTVSYLKILIGICTYPRDGIITYKLLKDTVNTLLTSYKDIPNIELKIILIGDDYTNIEELRGIFSEMSIQIEIYNININDALRNKNTNKEIKWMHAVTRSLIFLFEKALESNYDYLLISADDEKYINSMFKTNIEYIRKHNNPDFIYSLGKHPNGVVYPIYFNKSNLLLNYPEPENCTESGTFYKLHNREFIKDIINFRKERWEKVRTYIEYNEINYKEYGIKPEDAELWEYLLNKFKNKKYSSLLVPHILIDHFTEGSIYNYLQ